MLILDYGSTHFKNKVVLTKFINPCRMVWDSIWGTSCVYESKIEEAKRGGKSAIWLILCCQLYKNSSIYSSILHVRRQLCMGEKKDLRFFQNFQLDFFYLSIPYKNIPKMLKLSKISNGKWAQLPSKIDFQYCVARAQNFKY